MRKVFESQRLENVEAVAAMLTEHGIETRIHAGRGWRGAIRGNFSYREGAPNREPASLWVVNSNDQTQARQLLREAGLFGDQDEGRPSYLPTTRHGGTAKTAAKSARSRGHALRILLIVAAVVLAAMTWFNNRANAPQPAPVAQATAAATPAPSMRLASIPDPYPAAMPTALASLLVSEFAGGQPACVLIDGADPSPEWLSQHAGLVADSACSAEMQRIHVGGYTTDGMGEGVADVSVKRSGESERAYTVQVQREGGDWRVLETLAR